MATDTADKLDMIQSLTQLELYHVISGKWTYFKNLYVVPIICDEFIEFTF